LKLATIPTYAALDFEVLPKSTLDDLIRKIGATAVEDLDYVKKTCI
jgi:hypothetical protein